MLLHTSSFSHALSNLILHCCGFRLLLTPITAHLMTRLLPDCSPLASPQSKQTYILLPKSASSHAPQAPVIELTEANGISFKPPTSLSPYSHHFLKTHFPFPISRPASPLSSEETRFLAGCWLPHFRALAEHNSSQLS